MTGAEPGVAGASVTGSRETVVIDPRFCGPPGTGNGGYVAGLLAARLGGAGEITLRRPPPVATALEIVAGAGQSVSLVHGPDLIAEGVAGGPDGPVPAAVALAEARAAGAACRLRAHPEEHPYPGCFVCGPDRGPGDGLGIMVGPVAGRDLAADVWYPDGSLAGPGGEVAPEFLWAALDCSGGVGAIGNEFQDGPPWVLGRYAARQAAPVRAGEPHVVVGWRLAVEGRKLLAGSAVFTPAGQLAGLARATWIQLR
ncbi:MAG TPA: hypothetical protein VK586_03320 [Streptosporangiaceae bacterium]|nr:hypothetical protein [Streptosporangiaceae bacterium]